MSNMARVGIEILVEDIIKSKKAGKQKRRSTKRGKQQKRGKEGPWFKWPEKTAPRAEGLREVAPTVERPWRAALRARRL